MKVQALGLSLMFTALILILNVQVTFPYLFNGNEILDLQSNGTAFVFEANAWSISNMVKGNTIYSVCDGDYILGGYNVLQSNNANMRNQYFQRIYNGLPVHAVIRFVINIYVIDSWDSNDSFKLSFDDTVIDGLHLWWKYFPPSVCGQTGWPDIKDMKTYGTVPHSGRSLQFRALSSFDQGSNDESFGFRNVNFIFSQTPANVTALCGRAAQTLNNLTFVMKQQCSCPEGLYWNGTRCVQCDTSCSSCYGPRPTDCYACNKPGFAWNGTHCAACSQGCASCTGRINDNSCLPCNPNQVYYPETQQCLDYCEYPLKQVDNTVFGRQCQYPCSPAQFLLGNQTCRASCPSPNKLVKFMDTFRFCTN